jgi:hypothetical protein
LVDGVEVTDRHGTLLAIASNIAALGALTRVNVKTGTAMRASSLRAAAPGRGTERRLQFESR